MGKNLQVFSLPFQPELNRCRKISIYIYMVKVIKMSHFLTSYDCWEALWVTTATYLRCCDCNRCGTQRGCFWPWCERNGVLLFWDIWRDSFGIPKYKGIGISECKFLAFAHLFKVFLNSTMVQNRNIKGQTEQARRLQWSHACINEHKQCINWDQPQICC